MPTKKLHKELKAMLTTQIEIEGFDYAMTEKMGPNDWDEGVVPEDLKAAWNEYLRKRQELKKVLETYEVDPQ